jgi:hypothetical protein
MVTRHRDDTAAARGWIALVRRYGFIPAIAAFSLALYAYLFRIPFALPDDFMTLYYSSAFRFPADLLKYNGCWPWLYRPVQGLYYYAEYLLFGTESGLYYAMSFVLLLALSFLAYWLFLRLLGRPGLSLLLTLLFASHRFVIVPATWATDAGNILVQVFFVGFLLLALPLIDKGKALSNGRRAMIILLCILAPLSKETGLIIPAMGFLLFLFIRKDNIMRVACVAAVALVLLLRLSATGGSFDHPGDDTAFFFDTVTLYEIGGGPLQKLPYAAYTYLANVIGVFVPLFTEKGYPFTVDRAPLVLVDLFYLATYSALSLVIVAFARRDRTTLFMLSGIVIYCCMLYSEFRFRNLVVPTIMYFTLLALALGNAPQQGKAVKAISLLIAAMTVMQLAYGFVFVKATYELRAATDLEAVAADISGIADSPFLTMTDEDRAGILQVVEEHRAGPGGAGG